VSKEGAVRLGPMAIGFAINPALALLKQAGIEALPLLIRAGLSEEHTVDFSLRRVPAAAQARFLEYAAEALGDGALGLHLAAAGDPRTVGLVFYLGAAAKNLREALELMTRYVSIADECARLNLAPEPDGVALEYKFAGLSRHLLRQQSEFALAMAIKAIRLATGREIRPVRVRFAHVRTSDLKDFVRFFGCPVEFSAPSDRLAFSSEALALPLITADPQLVLTLRPICEAEVGALNKKAGSLRASVETEVQRLLSQGQANIDTVAKALGLSARTLSRNLAAEGLAFTEIMDQLRHTLALEYLKEPNLPLAQIAWLLGYEGPTSFTHAFRRWAGRPPSVVRGERRDLRERVYRRPGANGPSG
jgi:AraC-like DNA-binding protein